MAEISPYDLKNRWRSPKEEVERARERRQSPEYKKEKARKKVIAWRFELVRLKRKITANQVLSDQEKRKYKSLLKKERNGELNITNVLPYMTPVRKSKNDDRDHPTKKMKSAEVQDLEMEEDDGVEIFGVEAVEYLGLLMMDDPLGDDLE